MKRQLVHTLLFSLVLSALLIVTATQANAQGTLPTPDFSAIAPWYDVVKWNYDDTGKITFVVKAKTPAPQLHRLFSARYLDEDGIDVTGPSQLITFGYRTEQGQTERVEASAPEASKLKKVKSFAIYRILDDGSLLGPTLPKPPEQNNPDAVHGGLPMPDFSVMELWYEVVKWNYDNTGKITFVVKAKNPAPQLHRLFSVRYIDADGIDVIEPAHIITFGYGTAQGQPERVEASAPGESQIKRVKTFIVYRILDDGSLAGPAPVANTVPQNVSPATTTNHAPTKTPGAVKNGGKPANQTKTKPAMANMDPDCFSHKPPPSNAKMKFSEALIKSLLYERYSFETDIGGLSSPAAIGVKYLSIRLGKSYKNTITVVPGRGAQRRNDAAPPYTTIYNFTAKYIVCRKYSDSVVRTQYESDFAAFKAKNGNWDCGVDSVPKITTLK
ncbi:hypothetical protein IAD21_01551 [Abditibacteriota bacterium]|nr:hypothetical protein IAD21_01551 [Abditibacteriota bacterium]